MRVASDTTLLVAEPGTMAALTIDVVNTDDVIAGVSANIIGLATEFVSSRPQVLPLFPDSSGQVKLDLQVPPQHPAGRHPLTIEVVAHGTAGPPDYLDVDLDVAAHPGLRVSATPRIVRARRSGRFVLEVVNTGNVALDVSLTGVDPDRQVQTTFSPPALRVAPGSTAPVLLAVRGPRMITGAELDRSVAVEVTARPVPVVVPHAEQTMEIARIPSAGHPDALGAPIAEPGEASMLATVPEPTAAEATAEVVIVREVAVRLRQRPIISRGLLTVLILLGIVLLWAAIFLFGLGKVFAGDPMTKQAPASFFASSAGAGGSGSGSGGSGSSGSGSGGSGSGGSGSGGSGGGGGGGAAGAAVAAPAGALSKTGQVPAGTGGAITGTVVATTDQQPVGRILVTAYRQGPKGPIQMSSAATQTDGTYTLAGLFPTDYVLRFSRTGFRTVWYPNKPTQTGAQTVTAAAQSTTDGINATVTGLPATISGSVNPGDTLTSVSTVVTARPVVGSATGKTIARATTGADNSYTLRNLPAPGSYELTFTTPGYSANTLVDTVSGGDKRIEPTVTLGASAGQISGTVTDDGAPLGGATVTTTIAGRTVSVGTPTTGRVGAYVIGNLPTPATYVVTVSSPGRGSQTQIVALTAGQSKTNLDVGLSGGTGSVQGKVIGPKGKGIGGVTVTVGGSSSGGSTTTITTGDPGTFVLNGLRSPGSYTLSATLAGYSVASTPVTLPLPTGKRVIITLSDRLGSVSGRVTTTARAAVGGATITATNGIRSITTTSDSARGVYRLDDLEPGSYSVTVTAPGRAQTTALVSVSSGDTVTQNIALRAS